MKRTDVVLITGTSRGIGRYLAEHFLKKGSIVYGCSRSPVERTRPRYFHHVADVTNESQVKELFSSIKKHHGRLDITINNAGIAFMNHFLLMPVSTARKIVDTNLIGTFLICRESVKLMRKAGYGRIINFSSVAVPLNIEGEAVYAASKSAVGTLTRIIAREVSPYGITCNAIGPAPVRTDLLHGISSKKLDRLINSLAIKKFCKFEDIANIVDFLVAPASGSITGQVIYLGGP